MKQTILLYLLLISQVSKCADEPTVESDGKGIAEGEISGHHNAKLSVQNNSIQDDSMQNDSSMLDEDTNSTVSFQDDDPPFEPVTIALDILNTDDSTTTNLEQEYAGAHHHIIFPRKNTHIESVLENGVEIWKKEDNEECIFAEFYTRGEVTILYIDIKDGDQSSLIHFEKKDGVWKEITIENFYNILESIMPYSEIENEHGPS